MPRWRNPHRKQWPTVCVQDNSRPRHIVPPWGNEITWQSRIQKGYAKGNIQQDERQKLLRNPQVWAPTRSKGTPSSMATAKKARYQNKEDKEIQSPTKRRWVQNAKRRPLRAIICTCCIMELNDSSARMAHKTTRLCGSFSTSSNWKGTLHESTKMSRSRRR